MPLRDLGDRSSRVKKGGKKKDTGAVAVVTSVDRRDAHYYSTKAKATNGVWCAAIGGKREGHL